VFGWTLRRDDDEPAFFDATRHVIGHFVAGEPAFGDGGIRAFVYVDDVDDRLRGVQDYDGTASARPRAEGSLRVATFRDTEGTLVGLWTETAVARAERDP
jgi:predicted enzyme related to lactoylglutathione lyase